MTWFNLSPDDLPCQPRLRDHQERELNNLGAYLFLSLVCVAYNE